MTIFGEFEVGLYVLGSLLSYCPCHSLPIQCDFLSGLFDTSFAINLSNLFPKAKCVVSFHLENLT